MVVTLRSYSRIALATALLAGSSSALALGLGDLQLQSSLNQPLSASLILHGTEQLEPHEVQVRLADEAAFQRMGMAREQFLLQLRFETRRRGNQLEVLVSSPGTVREPYLSFLLEAQGRAGTVLREYNLLLDPPLYQPQPVTASRPTVSAVPATGQGRQAAAQPSLLPAADAQRYQTRSGDSLWSIANRFNPDPSVSLSRVMQAIHQLNPHAFVDGDINRLRTGQSLVLPTPGQLGLGAQWRPAAVAGTEDRPAPVSEPAVSSPAPVEPEQDARLSIDQADTTSVRYQEQLERLKVLETRFNLLLDELEDKDRQIALIESRLASVRRSREQGLAETGDTAAALAEQTGAEPQPGLTVAEDMSVDAPATVADNSNRAWLNWWPALLALLAGLLAVLLVRQRQRNDQEDDAELPPVAVAPVVAPAPRLQPRKPKPLPEVVDEADRGKPDPLDGVELYLAYGRYAEGRAMLEKAIEDEPQRLDLRYKLLRVLADMEDVEEFIAQEHLLLAEGGEAARIDAIKARFPDLFAGLTVAVRPDDAPGASRPLLDEADEAALMGVRPQSNLDDFSNEPNFDLFGDSDKDHNKPS